MQNFGLEDFDCLEEHYKDYFKAKNKKDSNFYYIKKYNNVNFDSEKIEKIQKALLDMSDITKLKFNGLFIQETKKGKDLYLIFEFFDGKLLCKENEFQNYEAWIIAKKLLEIFEKLSEKGIKFPKNQDAIDVFEVNLEEIKINIFEFICFDFQENSEANDKGGMLFNIGLILEQIQENNNENHHIIKGLIRDLKSDKIDIPLSKTLFNIFLKYSLYYGDTNNEIIFGKGMIYSGQLKDNKPEGTGILLNEYGIIYKGEFKEGKISGKGKSFIYNKNIGSKNKVKILAEPDKKCFSYNLFGGYNHPYYKNNTSSNKNTNLLKIFEGTFINLEKNGKYIEYDKNNSKIFEGEFKNDMRNGQGIEYNHGSKKFEGEYKNNIREGKGIEYNNGSKIFEGEFKNNKKNGNGILYINGEIKRYEGEFENDVFHGKGKLFYDNGKIHYFGNFNNGFFSGEGYYFDISGEKTKVLNGLPLINGKFPKGFRIYYNSGKIRYRLSLKNSKNSILDGKEYFTNEKVKYSGNFKPLTIDLKEKENINVESYRNEDSCILLIKDGNGINYDEQNGNVLYKGDFKLNAFDGKGIEYNYNYDNNCYIKYEGSYKNGNYHGYGIKYFYLTKTKEYEGNFINGVFNGKGTKYKYTGEEEYEGIFKDGYLISGYQNTDYYKGQIDKGMKEGKGKLYIDNKLRFEGLFKNNKFIEGVVYNLNNKKFFEGKINDDNKKEGKFFGEDSTFDGKFEDYCKVADYIIDFTNTCEINFEGEYKNGLKCGKGKDYSTGYEGEFLYGMYHGKGKYTSENIEGEFKNGKKTGYWKESNFEGEYKGGLRNGKGTENSWTGYYVNNYLHGIRRKEEQKKLYYFGEEVNILNLKIKDNCIYFNGIKEYEGDIVNGVKNGKGVEYYKDNKKRYEGEFKNGKHHGSGKEYYDNGILKYFGVFNNDVYDKKGIEYDETGNKLYEGEFKNGKYHGKGKLYRNGKIIYEGDFVDNKLQGKGKEFDEEGKILYSGDFQNNTYEGLGSRFFLKPYEGYWSNNRPARLKQGLYYIGKYLKLA